MDNQKIGSFIRDLRKEKDMTQKDLADRLHITDRAVSKWERGLNAPDIALLEPLAEVLEVSIPELIRGERGREAPEEAREVLAYAGAQLSRKLKATRRRYLWLLAGILAVILLMVGLPRLQGSTWLLLDRRVSPDGKCLVRVYREELNLGPLRFASQEPIHVLVEDGHCLTHRIYRAESYGGVWWSPDGEKYVLAVGQGEEARLVLERPFQHSSVDLNAGLFAGVEAAEGTKYGYAVTDEDLPEIAYRFLQWGEDGNSMLLYYYLADMEHEGYFWYNCETGQVSGMLE